MRCLKCPVDSYTKKCDCSEDASSSQCKECNQNSVNVYLTCSCTNSSATYDERINTCLACPNGSKGNVPDCDCGRRFFYDEFQNKCVRCNKNSIFKCLKCPIGSKGNYPRCECADGFYDMFENGCLRCGGDSTGVYPSCNCAGLNATFDKSSNSCLNCPIGSSGKIPSCKCSNELGKMNFFQKRSIFFSFFFLVQTIWIRYFHYLSISLWKNTQNYEAICLLNRKRYQLILLEYEPELKECVRHECPLNSFGKYPNCICPDGQTFKNGLCSLDLIPNYNKIPYDLHECPLGR